MGGREWWPSSHMDLLIGHVHALDNGKGKGFWTQICGILASVPLFAGFDIVGKPEKLSVPFNERLLQFQREYADRLRPLKGSGDGGRTGQPVNLTESEKLLLEISRRRESFNAQTAEMEQRAAHAQAVEDMITQSANGTRPKKRTAAEAAAGCSSFVPTEPIPGQELEQDDASGGDSSSGGKRRRGGGASAFTYKLQQLAQYQAEHAVTRQEREERAAIEEKRWTEDYNIHAETLAEAKRASQAREGLQREELEERKAARAAKDARDDKALELQVKTMDNMMVMVSGMQTMFLQIFEKLDK
eukprot:jgi/Mesvir1/17160/Mv07585-RA.1